MRSRTAIALLIGASLWSALLVVGAFTVPLYEGASESAACVAGGGCTTGGGGTGATLVAENGTGAAIVAAAPLATALLVGALLRRRCTTGSRVALAAAWVLVAALAGLTLLSLLSVGVFLFPATAMLAVAVALTPDGGREHRSPRPSPRCAVRRRTGRRAQEGRLPG